MSPNAPNALVGERGHAGGRTPTRAGASPTQREIDGRSEKGDLIRRRGRRPFALKRSPNPHNITDIRIEPDSDSGPMDIRPSVQVYKYSVVL